MVFHYSLAGLQRKPNYLQKRRRRWYAVLEIPKSLQHRIGKSRFVQSLKTDSLSLAEERVLPIIAEWKQLIRNLQSDDPNSFEAELADWRAHISNYKKQGFTDQEINELALDVADSLHPDPVRGAELYSVVSGYSILLTEHVEPYLNSQELEQKTIDMKRSDLKRFCTKFQFSREVNNRLLIEWVEDDLMEELGLSPATCRRIVSAVRGYWKYLQRRHGLDMPYPFDGVVPKARKKTKREVRDMRKHFTPTDYHTLLAAVPDTDPLLSDLIRLGAYTGCRIEEICSLKLEQVLHDRFKIEDAKSEAGWREVPIHSNIRQLAARLKDESKDGYFLSGLTHNKYGDRSNAIGKRFGRLKAKCGYQKDYVFHSFRKGVATQLEAADVPEIHVARILGHEWNTLTFGLYSGGGKFEVLSAAVERLRW